MWQSFKQKYLITFWSPLPAIIALAILSVYYFGITGTYWAVTGEMTRFGGHILMLLGINAQEWGYFKIIGLQGTPLERVDGVMIIGMFAGVLSAALMANNIKLRFPQSKVRIAQALCGGIIAGFGARMAMGCNLASFFTGIPQFSLHAWLFTCASLIGVYFGNKVAMSRFFASKVSLQKVQANAPETHKQKHKNHAKRNFVLGVAVLIVALCFALYVGVMGNMTGKHAILFLASLFGIAFGFIIARAQICFTSAFRDLFLTGRGVMARAVVIGMCVATIGVFSYIMLGVPPKIMWAAPNAVIGGLLFGFGIVLAGGCECGWMYRALEGQVHYMIVGIGNIIGATLLAATWEYYAAPLATSFPKINLLESFGNYGGLMLNYFLLFAFFCFILMLETYYIRKNRAHYANTH